MTFCNHSPHAISILWTWPTKSWKLGGDWGEQGKKTQPKSKSQNFGHGKIRLTHGYPHHILFEWKVTGLKQGRREGGLEKYIKALLWNDITCEKHRESKGERAQKWRPVGPSPQVRTPHKQERPTTTEGKVMTVINIYRCFFPSLFKCYSKLTSSFYKKNNHTLLLNCWTK